MRKSNGPSMDPCGTPQTRFAGSEKVESTFTIKLLLERYDLNQQIVSREKFMSSIFSRRMS